MDTKAAVVVLAILALALVVTGADVAAQQTQTQGPQTLDELVDFILRPTQEAADEEDIWNWDTEPEESLLDSEIGPPLAGPKPGDPIGPPLAGPIPEPIEEGRIRPRRVTAVDPYAATGVNLGSFIIRPSIEIGGIATDNGGGTSDKVAAIGLVVAPEVRITSETERYTFEAHGRGEVITWDHEEFNEQTAEARARLRYALTSATAVQAEAGYARFLEGFSDPDTPDAAAERPAVDEFDVSLGVEHTIGRLSTRATAFVDRAVHEEVPLAGGGVADRSELDNTEFGARFRAGYATSAVLRPFGEVAAGRREFDQAQDDSGFERSSTWGELRGGIVIDRGEKLSGEASIGYRHEDIEDDDLDDLNVFLANASILWSPRRLTEVRVDLTTDVSPTSTPFASASVIYAGTVTLARSLTQRVRAETGVGLSYEDRIGDDFRDVTFTGFADVSYAFNRVASIIGRYEYQRTDRNEVDGDFDAHEVSLRFRLQR
jgi:hypothetical protein